jgi:hypothetical protein
VRYRLLAIVVVGLLLAGCVGRSDPPLPQPPTVSTVPGTATPVAMVTAVAVPISASATVPRPTISGTATRVTTNVSATASRTASPGSAACLATTIRTSGSPVAAIPWVQAEPASAGIAGVLFYGNRPLHTDGRFPDHTAAKILWVVRHPAVGQQIEIAGQNLTGTGVVQQREDGVASAAPGYREFPSIVDLPTPGCWRLSLTSGAAMASVIFLVVAD